MKKTLILPFLLTSLTFTLFSTPSEPISELVSEKLPEVPVAEELIPLTDIKEAEEELIELEKEIEDSKKEETPLKDTKEEKSFETDKETKDELSNQSDTTDKQKEENPTITEDKKIIPFTEISEEAVIKKIPLSIASEEILNRSDVEKFRKQYMSPKWSNLLYSYLEDAMEYRLYVRKEVQDRNLPEVLEYLPVVESNYKPSAKSRSGALGMWQFMSNSVANFLTLNDFVDERLDPWYSTDAGLSKLTENYNYYHDWFLAIASYNCGLGAMNKALKRSKVKDYWYMVDHGLLPKQTAEYVPKLLAIADLAINSEYYGIDLPDHKEEFEILENEKNGHFDYVTVHKAYSLSSLAKELRISEKIMRRLNPSFVMGITHPAKESKIRLPLGLAPSAETALLNLTPIDYPFKYKVVAGDSLWSISRKYHTTVDAICELNDIKENDILKIGKILYIPSK